MLECPYKEAKCKCNNNMENVCAKFLAWNDAKKQDIQDKFLKKLFGNDIPNDKLEIMREVQKYLQEKQKEKNGKSIICHTFEEVNERMLMMERAMGDELAEVRQHLNWKDWKAPDWSKFEDLTELRKEVIDIFHFLLNMFIILDMNVEEIYKTFIQKNLENVLRQEYNY